MTRMSYDPEKLDAFEVGFKGTYFDGRARVNGAAYYYDYKDYQAFYIVGIDTITFNTDATSKGAELELDRSPIDGLDLLLGGAYNDIDVELPSGDVPSVQSPKWISTRWPAMNGPRLNGMSRYRATWRIAIEHFFALTGAETVRENGYSIVNTSISYTDCNSSGRPSAFVDNLLDEEYLVQTFDLSGPGVFDMTEQYYGRPRWWGVSLRYKWGA